MPLNSSGVQHIRQAMAGLSGAAARARAAELAAAYGITESTVYRHSREARTTSARATRGVVRKAVDPEALRQMVKKSVYYGMAATDVVDLAEQNGWIEPGQISPARFTRYLQSEGLSRKALKVDRRPYRRFQAEEPNEVFQIDATVAEQFYLDDDGSIGWESPSSRNKNRAGNRKPRLSILGIIDDHSRCTYAEFVTSVTTNDWLRFEFNCFRRKDDPRFIFHGIPKTLYMDNDAVCGNEKFQRAHQTLGIRVINHKPTKKTDRFSNARSKGKIERFFHFLAQKQRITKFKKFTSLEEANRFLWAVCHKKNLTRHSETGEAPYERWMRIRDERLIRCEDEELYAALYRDRRECLVYGDLTIRFGGQKHQLPPDEVFYRMIKQKVAVYTSPLEPDVISIGWEGQEYEVRISVAVTGSWGAGPVQHAGTPLERKLAELAQAEEWPMRVWGEFEDGAAAGGVACMPFNRGMELDTSRLKPQPRRISRHDAMMEIAQRLERRLSRDENRYLSALLAEQVTEDEIEAAFEKCRKAG